MAVNEIKILFAGDLAAVGSAESKPGRPSALQTGSEVKELFAGHDLVVVNLESPLTTADGKITKSGPHLKGHPESIALLKELGVHVACLSNNHIRDYGDQGVTDTIRTCQENGIHTVGAGKNIGEASQPLFLEIKGRTAAIMNFSETEFNTAGDMRAGSNPDDPIHIWETITAAKAKSDLQFVILHGGREMYTFPTPHQMRLFRFIADIGVTAVIGHHSHVTGGYEIFRNIPLVFSLGNFIFDEDGNPPEWYRGALASITIKEGLPAETRFYPVLMQDGKVSLGETTRDFANPDEVSNMKPVTEETVVREWNMLVEGQSEKIIKGLLASNRIMGLLLKFRIISISRHRKYLIALLNRFRCLTHRDITTESINHYIQSNREK